MGTLLSRHGGTVVPEAGTRRNHSYTYPTRDGKMTWFVELWADLVAFVGGDYFSSHYHLGPRKFETAESEQFLFGEMADLNFLTAPPTAVRSEMHMIIIENCLTLLLFLSSPASFWFLLIQFPYKQLSSKRQPLNCLYSLLNVHRESVRLVRWGQQPASFWSLSCN